MAGKATGERIPGKKYRAIVEAAAIGDPINRIARKVGVTWRTVKAVVGRESREIAERKQELLDSSLDLAQRAADQLHDQLPNASIGQTNAIYGTAMDKIAILSGDPALIIDPVLENALGVGAGLVWVTFLIAVGRVGRNGDKGFFGRGPDADGEGLFHPGIDHPARQPNAICGARSVRLSRGKRGFAEQHATRQRCTYLA